MRHPGTPATSKFSPISHGTPVAELRLDGFRVTEACYGAGVRIPAHGHEAASLTFVVRGGGDERVGSRREPLAPHEMLVKPAAAVHSNTFGGSGARLLLVEVLPPVMERTPVAARAFAEVRRIAARGLAAPAVRVLAELRRRDEFSELCVEGMLLELVGTLGRAEAPGDTGRALLRVRERLHEEFRAPPRIAELAADVELSAAHLSRRFRAAYGCGIGEYVRGLRLEWAMRALAGTDRSISSIALEAGFADQSHFTRGLRQATGMTPAAYRARAR
ncbi:MAG TPA: AraC family transcriptional regulator [Longimicrobium sp.]